MLTVSTRVEFMLTILSPSLVNRLQQNIQNFDELPPINHISRWINPSGVDELPTENDFGKITPGPHTIGKQNGRAKTANHHCDCPPAVQCCVAVAPAKHKEQLSESIIRDPTHPRSGATPNKHNYNRRASGLSPHFVIFTHETGSVRYFSSPVFIFITGGVCSPRYEQKCCGIFYPETEKSFRGQAFLERNNLPH
jgi:hypothetical protein